MNRFTQKYITKHGRKRLRERLGLKKKAHARHIQKVLENGLIEYKDMEKNILYIWYNYHKYIFDNYRGLITVFPRDEKHYIANNKNYITPHFYPKNPKTTSYNLIS